jgi:hypothetical protein
VRSKIIVAKFVDIYMSPLNSALISSHSFLLVSSRHMLLVITSQIPDAAQ